MKLRYGIAAVLIVMGCAATAESPNTSASTAPIAAGASPAHVSEEQAIARAREHVTMSDVVGATSGRYDELRAIPADRSIRDDQMVWAVAFTGDVEICPPSPGPCFSPRPGTATVFLDYYSGAFLGASTVSPG